MRKVFADLHNHLKTGSYMPEGIFNRTAEIVRRRLGEGGIIGLVNFEDRRYEDFSELSGYERVDFGNALYVPEKDVMIVRGQEVPTKHGHLLVLGLKKGKNLKGGRSLEDSLKEARDENGIIIADHPFYKEGIGHSIDNLPEDNVFFDAIEVHNGSSVWIPFVTPRNSNEESELFYLLNTLITSAHSIGAISASDGHSLYELGRSYTRLEMPQYNEIKDAEQLVDCLKIAIRKARPEDCVRKNSRLGAIKHLFELGLIIIRNSFKKHLKTKFDIHSYEKKGEDSCKKQF